MPTLAQLRAEQVWKDETIPVELAYLARNLRNHWELTAGAVGTIGNERHVKGYHRSRNWVLKSKFCKNRKYSVTETAGNKSGGNGNWICAIDISLPARLLLPACKRLDDAVRAGQLEKIAEWYGNTDGDSRVDGYDNIENELATSDNSHLWHLHISFVRSRANDNHADVFAVLTGVGWTPPQSTPSPKPPADLEWTEQMIRNLPALRMGATGAHVRTAQALLRARGYTVNIDGQFGPDTRTKTLAMQRDYGAEHIDADWGPETWTIGILGRDLR